MQRCACLEARRTQTVLLLSRNIGMPRSKKNAAMLCGNVCMPRSKKNANSAMLSRNVGKRSAIPLLTTIGMIILGLSHCSLPEEGECQKTQLMMMWKEALEFGLQITKREKDELTANVSSYTPTNARAHEVGNRRADAPPGRRDRPDLPASRLDREAVVWLRLPTHIQSCCPPHIPVRTHMDDRIEGDAEWYGVNNDRHFFVVAHENFRADLPCSVGSAELDRGKSALIIFVQLSQYGLITREDPP